MLNGDRKIVSLEKVGFYFLSLEFQKMTTALFDFMLLFIWKFVFGRFR